MPAMSSLAPGADTNMDLRKLQQQQQQQGLQNNSLLTNNINKQQLALQRPIASPYNNNTLSTSLNSLTSSTSSNSTLKSAAVPLTKNISNSSSSTNKSASSGPKLVPKSNSGISSSNSGLNSSPSLNAANPSTSALASSAPSALPNFQKQLPKASVSSPSIPTAKAALSPAQLSASQSSSVSRTSFSAPAHAPASGSASKPFSQSANIVPLASQNASSTPANPITASTSVSDLISSKSWLLRQSLASTKFTTTPGAHSSSPVTIKKEQQGPSIPPVSSSSSPSSTHTNSTMPSTAMAANKVKTESSAKIPLARNAPDFAAYKNLAIASNLLNIKPTTLGPSPPSTSTSHSSSFQPKIAPAKLLPNVQPNIIPKPQHNSIKSENNNYSNAISHHDKTGIKSSNASNTVNDKTNHLTYSNIASHTKKLGVNHSAAPGSVGSASMQRSSSSNTSLLSCGRDPAELKSILNSKVKENEKLKIIIDKLRDEINILKVLQDKSSSTNNHIDNNTNNISNHTTINNNANTDSSKAATSASPSNASAQHPIDKSKTIQHRANTASSSTVGHISETINPMKLSTNLNQGSDSKSNDSNILRDLNNLLMTYETDSQSKFSIKKRKESKPNKRQHLNTYPKVAHKDDTNQTKSNNGNTDNRGKTSISHSMLNLSLLENHKLADGNDVDDGILDERLSSSSPSPSLSLTMSNSSEITELDIDSLLMINSPRPMSPVSASINGGRNMYNEDLFRHNSNQNNEGSAAHQNGNMDNPVSHYLNTNTHHDSNTLKKLLLSNTSVKLERSRSLNSYNDNINSSLASDYYYDLAVALENQEKQKVQTKAASKNGTTRKTKTTKLVAKQSTKKAAQQEQKHQQFTDLMDIDSNQLMGDPSLSLLSSNKQDISKEVELFLDYDPVSDDKLSGATGPNGSPFSNNNIDEDLYLKLTAFNNNLDFDHENLLLSNNGGNGESSFTNPALNELKSLKLERSFSVPTYSEPSKSKSKSDSATSSFGANLKSRPIKRPTKHFNKASNSTTGTGRGRKKASATKNCSSNATTNNQENSKDIQNAKPRTGSVDSSSKSMVPNFEPCGFCVDGTPCLCLEAALDMSNSKAKLGSDNSCAKMDIDIDMEDINNDNSSKNVKQSAQKGVEGKPKLNRGRKSKKQKALEALQASQQQTENAVVNEGSNTGNGSNGQEETKPADKLIEMDFTF